MQARLLFHCLVRSKNKSSKNELPGKEIDIPSWIWSTLCKLGLTLFGFWLYKELTMGICRCQSRCKNTHSLFPSRAAKKLYFFMLSILLNPAYVAKQWSSRSVAPLVSSMRILLNKRIQPFISNTHIFLKVRVTANKNALNFQHYFRAQFFMSLLFCAK